jgi:6-phosphofructokinase 1
MANLITQKLGVARGRKLRVRADTFGYLQRSFPGYVSPTDASEARLVGRMAVRYSGQQDQSGSVAMKRLANGANYRIETFLTPLQTVARETKDLPAEWVVTGNDIADAFKEYALPLVGKLPEVGSLEELG